MQTESKYKAALFDLDGTLIISKPSQPEALLAILQGRAEAGAILDAYAAAEIWLSRQIDSENRTGATMDAEQRRICLRRLYQSALRLSDESCDLIEGVITGEYPREKAVRECAPGLLTRLRAFGVKTGIVTNNPPEARALIREAGLEALADAVLISGEAGVAKPDPRIILRALATLNVAPGDAVFLGDSPFDVLCAARAGAASAWLDNGEFRNWPVEVPRPDYALCDMREFEKVIWRG